MNERIRELLLQSGAYDYYEINEGVEGDEKQMEKFAELIVRECVDKIFDSPKGIGAERWKDDVLAELKQHFGVEE